MNPKIKALIATIVSIIMVVLFIGLIDGCIQGIPCAIYTFCALLAIALICGVWTLWYDTFRGI